jgi:hypothetical protein
MKVGSGFTPAGSVERAVFHDSKARGEGPARPMGSQHSHTKRPEATEIRRERSGEELKRAAIQGNQGILDDLACHHQFHLGCARLLRSWEVVPANGNCMTRCV